MGKLPGKTLRVGILEEIEKDEVKKRIDLVSLFASFGVGLKNKGKSYTGKCPLHEGDDLTLSVDREKGIYQCFECGETGDAVTLVERLLRLEFQDALTYLRDWPANGNGHEVPVPTITHRDVPHPDATQKTEEPETLSVSDPSIEAPFGDTPPVFLDDIALFYTSSLYESAEAVAYLEGHGLRDRGNWERFKIGYASGKLSERLSDRQKAYLTEKGIFSEGKESHAGCITIPLYDENEKVVAFHGLSVSGNREIKNLGSTGFFNRKALSVYRQEIILTETVIDGLSLIELGFQNVFPCYGKNGFTPVHLKALKDEAVKTVVIAFGPEETKAIGKLKEKLLKEGFSVKGIFPPLGKSWNEYLVSGGDAETVKSLFSQAGVEEPETEPAFTVEKENGKLVFRFAEIVYRLIGVKDLFVSSLKVNVRAELGLEKFIDNVDLYSARSRTSFSASLSALFDIEAKRIERDLVQILEHLEAERDKKLSANEKEIVMTEEDKKAGLELLRDPRLFDRIVSDTEKLGYVGEEVNKLLLYLSATSRKLSDPLSVMVISESGSGKSYLIETVARLMPSEDVVSITSLSDQALNYLPEDGLLHKFLVMGEALHSESVELQIREMLSAHELSRLVTLKDPKTGELKSSTVRKKVLVASAMSTTSHLVNPENASRFFVVNADESREQTGRIHEAQRRKYSVSRFQEKDEEIPRIVKTHQAAQRLLEKKRIVNPFASLLSFPTSLMRTRRDHERFLDLIASVCFLRQFQKSEKEENGIRFIECDLEDYRIAFRIMAGILPSTLGGFPLSAKAVYDEVRKHIHHKAEESDLKPSEVSVTQREIRDVTGLPHMTIKRAFRVLVDYEYLIEGGLKIQGSRRVYRLSSDEPIRGIDLAMIPTPEVMALKLQNI